MPYLLTGLVLFFSVHLVPLIPSLRSRLQERLGPGIYRLFFAIISVAGLVFIALGLGSGQGAILWQPLEGARVLAMMAMPLAWILVVAAYMPSYLRAKLRHPMLLGVLLWGLVHLLANGDFYSTLVFGAFVLYSLVDMALTRPRESMIPRGKPRLLFDGVAVLVGLGLFAVVLHGHGILFGVPLVIR